MNRSKLKTYAPQARRDFIQAVTDRAAFYGLSPKKIEPVTEKGDVAIIAGRAFPKSIVAKRKALEDRIKRTDFEQTMEALAYTWFNRLVAIRFMELHGYLEHGYRVLSNTDPAKDSPEILEHAEYVDLPGLNRELVVELKLAGNKEAELYRVLLVAQCNALHTAMPFLFERIEDETELVLPESLLHTDSLVRKLVSEIDEENWNKVEIIGWLYQFYISEKKDEVIGKVVKSEDIPAATQLFTPNWIVKYLVHNTLGRQWLATYPQSPLRQQMENYIEPAEQTPEVQEQLKAITPMSLNPEELTLLDPACGSGHILVEAYDLFKAIYQERGYRAKDIPALILNKNLFGLEIDDRAAQLAAFALIMKARAHDRNIFDSEAKPNILAFQESRDMNAAEITHALNSPIGKEDIQPSEYLIEEVEEEKTPLFTKKVLAEKGLVSQADIASLVELFENAKTFGSLVQIPPKLAAKLPEIEKRLDDVLKFGDLTHASAHVLKPLLQQARFLSRQHDAVVANPPYMGGGKMNKVLSKFVGTHFPDSKADLMGCFMERAIVATLSGGLIAMINQQSWMFLDYFKNLRKKILSDVQIQSLLHLGPRTFPEISGEVVQNVAFVLENVTPHRPSTFYRLIKSGSTDAKRNDFLSGKNKFISHQDRFSKIPGTPIGYWFSDKMLSVFADWKPLCDYADVRAGLQTGDNDLFVRCWHEVSIGKFGSYREVDGGRVLTGKWFPYNKGGSFRKWYGNRELVIDWEGDGENIRNDKLSKLAEGKILASNSKPKNTQYYFRKGVTWSTTGGEFASFRTMSSGELFDIKGSSFFPNSISHEFLLGLMNSSVARSIIGVLTPTLDYNPGYLAKIPIVQSSATLATVENLVTDAITYSKADWDYSETSWDFQDQPLVSLGKKCALLPTSWEAWEAQCITAIRRMRELEIENNRIFIEAYGLQDELLPDVPDEQITLYRPDRQEDVKRLLSYAIGCMMGRYSLDKPGLTYAHSGNQGFDPSQYQTFRADDDGIIPLLEADWGIQDDATNRLVEFIGVAWPKEHFEENLKFIADSLGPTNGEQPRDTIRRYLSASGAGGFYKHHLSMYKRRPIYWLFSSGKQRAFQCLVYLHRYHEGTLGRMRTEYVIPLQGTLSSRIEQLATDVANATSTSHRKKLEKERDRLIGQQAELKAFDEKLRHYADQRITLDLDDGVKVNYAKFGDLLAETKAVTGGKAEE